MKQIAVVFLLAILVPAVLLAALAVRSLRDQEVVVNSQRAMLHQSTCDEVVANINLFMNDVRNFYGRIVDELVASQGARVVNEFDRLLTDEWTQAATGAVVSDTGVISSPTGNGSGRGAAFLENHSDFLTNSRVVEVYQAPELLGEQIRVIVEPDKPEADTSLLSTAEDAAPPVDSLRTATEPEARKKVGISSRKLSEFRFEKKAEGRNEIVDAMPAAVAEAEPSRDVKLGIRPGAAAVEPRRSNLRNVRPVQQMVESPVPVAAGRQLEGRGRLSYSSLNAEALSQNDLVNRDDEGAVGRIIDGQLHVLLWKRHPELPGFTLWAELDLEAIKTDLSELFVDHSASSSPAKPEVSLALLDSNGDLITQTESGFSTDWSTPFVAAEVGQVLPRWEVAAYLLDPESLTASAKTARFTLGLITLILLGAVGAGSFLILRSVNYEMRLASRKTDFVGNVSHELKTPLTSIRMFSELLEQSGPRDADRTREYAGVIRRESARLGRLINRLLDFSRLDRGEFSMRNEKVDLRGLVLETVETHRLQVESEGLEVEVRVPPGGVAVAGDRDALAQVLLNLLANAEKYAAGGGEVQVELSRGPGSTASISVRDRGPGIRRSHQRRIFDKFYRADDSIASGIEGSGIGLALCRQILELHGGTIGYSRREGGGSVFTVELPVTEEDENH
ncbi:MAG: HAMP domain-containing sensor histidine kinase [Verrucomicrobiales bacterium]